MSQTTDVRRLVDSRGPVIPRVMMNAEAGPAPLYDLSRVDLSKEIVTREEIQQVLPQRHEMEQLAGIIHIDWEADVIIGRRSVQADEFWVKTMPPEQVAMPATLLLECAAQLSAYWGMTRQPHMGFVGFAKCDGLALTGKVIPPAEVYMLAKVIDIKPRRVVAQCQAICNGRVVFAVTITGMSV